MKGLLKGQVGDGALYVVVSLLVIGGVSMFFIGNLPSTRAPQGGQRVRIVSPSAHPAQSDLQLETFAGIPVSSASAGKMVSCGYSVNGTNEPSVLYDYEVNSTAASGNQTAVKVFYTDEWPLTLGAGNISAMTKTVDHIANPNFGDTNARDSDGLPYFPSVYLTDITNSPTSTSGDAQHGGTPQQPSDVYGTWKPLGQSDPTLKYNGNGYNLGPGADALPTTPNGPIYSDPALSKDALKGTIDQQWTAEVIWKTSTLKLNGQPLQAGHTYRAEIIIHDGDKDGDLGMACANVQM